MGDFRKKIKSLAHRYYSWLTLLSMENTDLDHEEEYDEYAKSPDKVSYFSSILGRNRVDYRKSTNS